MSGVVVMRKRPVALPPEAVRESAAYRLGLSGPRPLGLRKSAWPDPDAVAISRKDLQKIGNLLGEAFERFVAIARVLRAYEKKDREK
jgi:hypothetical protein